MNRIRQRETVSDALAERLATIGDTPTRMVLIEISRDDLPFDSCMIEAAISLSLDQLHERLADSFGEDKTLQISEVDQVPSEVPADLRISFTLVLERTIVWHA